MAAAPDDVRDVLDRIGLPASDVPEVVRVARRWLADEVDAVVEEGSAAVPVVDFERLRTLDDATRDRIRRRGCVVVRGTFPDEQALDWDRCLGDYLERNRFEELHAARHPEAAATGSRIWGVYWSRPQVEARQDDRMDLVRRTLNSLWRHTSDDGTSWFDPEHDIAYPDRVRRRAPGVMARGLPPHVDSAASGGWRVPENIEVFAHLLAGHPERHDAFDAAHRTALDDRAAAICGVFRSFQGWTALSETRPSDGGLLVAPIPLAIGYRLLVGIADDLAEDREPSPTWRIGDEPLLRPAMVPIPAVRPGDTVWWHGDLVHAVGAATNDLRWSNVMYIGVSPRCERNDAYAASMYERFVDGRSPVDFPDEDLEIGFVDRASTADLNDRGRRQFGVAPVA